ncbi:hypothetical protein [Streptococcus sp. HF-2466]|uniref:hypothetical protein n=1 Tax=Streptococcus sp. HF-2466 TaxID=2785792 RepID=UPI000E8706BF|nr:hypothetical protein [Streptococcus sp. HF-2466]MBF7049981.1 hypothetical protein [Streptococcus sp. HF-2466]HBJ54491.1 hypothetical protein [Streptococcus sp.]
MAQINIKLTDEQKEEISRIAKEKGVSITQLVINSILNKEQFYTDNEDIERKENSKESTENNLDNNKENLLYKELCEVLQGQIAQKDIQIDQLHKIIYNKDTLLIEQDTRKKHWWEFWKTNDKD